MVTQAKASLISNRSTSPTFQPVFVQQLLDRADRGGGELGRLAGVGGVADDPGDGLQALVRRRSLARVEDERGGAVGDDWRRWRR